MFGTEKQQNQKLLDGKDGIGFYKGNTVFIKKLRKQTAEEISPFCKELVQVDRVMNHKLLRSKSSSN